MTNPHLSITLTPDLRLDQALRNAGVKTPATITKLTIYGTIAVSDFYYIAKKMRSTLQELDLGQASVENNKFPSPYYVPSRLISITLPKTVHKFSDNAFTNYSGLTSITAHPDDPFYSTEEGVLFNKDKSELLRCPEGREGAYTIPNSVARIGKNAFYHCEHLDSVTIPHSVTKIDDGAFTGCNLVSITIPASVTHIGDFVFSDCEELTSIIIDPDNPVYESKKTVIFSKERTHFSICLTPELRLEQALKNAGIKYPASVTKLTISGTMHQEDFHYLQEDLRVNLQELDMGSAWVEEKKIPCWCFDGYTELISITIPASVEHICIPISIEEDYPSFNGCVAFNNCSSLTNIAVDPHNRVYTSDNGVLLSRDRTVLLVCPKGMKGDYVVPDTVTIIVDSAFAGCTGLTSVTIPNSVKKMGERVFRGCTGLTLVTIPASLVEIGFLPFGGCSALTSIVIDVANPVFAGEGGTLFNKDKSVLIQSCIQGDYIIPDSVARIENYAFCNCAGLRSVTIPNSVVEIGEGAFNNCTDLTSISIPERVKEISPETFAYCTGLTSIIIPNSVVKIGEYAFSCCTGLTSITIPDSVIEIEASAFSCCTGLTSITIPDSVIEIGFSAFSSCKGLTSITIPNSVANIRFWAFAWCSGLTLVTIPDSVVNIEERVFEGCTGLTSITIPDSVVHIEGYAFVGCSSLTSVSIPASVVEIDEGAFYNCPALFTVHPDNPVYESVEGEIRRKPKSFTKIDFNAH